jgi:hypothetical protein
MNAPEPVKTALPEIGQAFEGGFFAGQIMINGIKHGLIVAPKAEGELNSAWHDDDELDVTGATSYDDGLTNTNAMAESGSPLAKHIRALTIGGQDDWYLPAQDELEIIYRNLKPTTEENSQYGRSGINLSAVPPTRPYTAEIPTKTLAEAFQKGGSEAFADNWYWSSTQHAAYAGCAWFQLFDNGHQYRNLKYSQLRARAVRRFAI